jgi:DNA-binding CsgD family transcriptional regulator
MEVKRRQDEQLTDRERQLISYIAGGYKDEETAEILGIQPQSIRGTVNSLLRRLKLVNRPSLVYWAVQNKII